MQKRLSPLEKEWIKLQKQEQIYMQKRMEKKDSRLNQLLEKKVPQNLQKTLDTAFSKAFYLIFEKGTGVIEKTYKKEELEKTYKINEFARRQRYLAFRRTGHAGYRDRKGRPHLPVPHYGKNASRPF